MERQDIHLEIMGADSTWRSLIPLTVVMDRKQKERFKEFLKKPEENTQKTT